MYCVLHAFVVASLMMSFLSDSAKADDQFGQPRDRGIIAHPPNELLPPLRRFSLGCRQQDAPQNHAKKDKTWRNRRNGLHWTRVPRPRRANWDNCSTKENANTIGRIREEWGRESNPGSPGPVESTGCFIRMAGNLEAWGPALKIDAERLGGHTPTPWGENSPNNVAASQEQRGGESPCRSVMHGAIASEW
ncbi:hypothetical protein B0J18DRAFT_76683 [Chaetomium sp. MPI-SDFR-AT-0129]|nr:hypothetical protein B0J18DRAFT_76683 [Chaetomium sp. MPI-SDFR-AT-0129]